MNPYYDVFHNFTIIYEFDYELLYIFLTFMIYLRDQIKNSIEIPTLSQFLGHKMTYTKIYQFLTFDLLKRGQMTLNQNPANGFGFSILENPRIQIFSKCIQKLAPRSNFTNIALTILETYFST